VVVAANYAARAFGIRSAMPIREAWRRCPDALYVFPDHAFYMDISRRIFNDLRAGYAIEQTSVDESFLDITDLTTWDDAPRFAGELHARIQRASGSLTCSIGIAPNKLVAKIASDFNKPNGTTLVRPDQVQGFLDPLAARKIPGIGPKTAERLSDIGIETIRQLREIEGGQLAAAFGEHGEYMRRAARGEDDSSVHPEGRIRKSMSEEHTFDEDTRDRARLLGSVRRMVSSLESDLRRRNYWYRSVAVKIRYSDFSTHTRQAALPRPAFDTTPARRVLPQLLAGFLQDPRAVRLVGVRFGDLAVGNGQRMLHEYAAA
jgi:nucleotidyltransferase/DNA polymerase involved in DNA repair